MCKYSVIIARMPVIKSAKKKLRADERKKVFNKVVRDKVRVALKQFKANPSSKTLDGAYASLDTAAKKHVIPKKRADRKKGRLAIFLSSNKKIKVVSKPKGKKAASAKAKAS